MELIFFGINVLLIMIVWHFLIRPTILDHSRDRLFDLRDELRATFAKNDWQMDSATYRSLRDLVNGYLRFTEEVSVFRIAYFKTVIKKDLALEKHLQERVNRMFESAQPDQKAVVMDIRRRALDAAIDYSVFSSGGLLMAVVVVTPFVAIGMACSLAKQQVDFTTSVFWEKAEHLGRSASALISASTSYIARKVLLPDAIESYSMRPATV
jgi:hypothetical protein